MSRTSFSRSRPLRLKSRRARSKYRFCSPVNQVRSVRCTRKVVPWRVGLPSSFAASALKARYTSWRDHCSVITSWRMLSALVEASRIWLMCKMMSSKMPETRLTSLSADTCCGKVRLESASEKRVERSHSGWHTEAQLAFSLAAAT